VSVSLEEVPEVARIAWVRLRDELRVILGEDLVALWGYGGTTFSDPPRRLGDLDTYAVVGHPPDEQTSRRIEEAHEAIAREHGVEWDAWYVLVDDARRPESPRHAFREGRRDTSWAINRAHLVAGRYVHLHGQEPGEVVPAPTWDEIAIDLSRELEHMERHVAEGDNDPYEATYAIFNGSRILRAVETGDVVISKRSAGEWALGHLPDTWHSAIRGAGRACDAEATPGDADLLAAAMAPFVAMVRERLPAQQEAAADALPRWSGY
jgi:hypothetical protein